MSTFQRLADAAPRFQVRLVAEAFVHVVFHLPVVGCRMRGTDEPAPPEEERKRIEIVQALIDAAGYRATATCSPDPSGRWPTAPTGEDWDVVNLWLDALVGLVRSKADRPFREAVNCVEAQIAARAAHLAEGRAAE